MSSSLELMSSLASFWWSSLRFHPPDGGGRFRGSDELHHVPVGVLDEDLPETGRSGHDVAAREPQLFHAARGGVGVLRPEREVRIPGDDLLSLDGGPHELIVQDDVQRKAVSEAIPDAGEVEGRTRNLLEPEKARVELPCLGDVGDGDAHVVQLLEQAHHGLLDLSIVPARYDAGDAPAGQARRERDRGTASGRHFPGLAAARGDALLYGHFPRSPRRARRESRGPSVGAHDGPRIFTEISWRDPWRISIPSTTTTSA